MSEVVQVPHPRTGVNEPTQPRAVRIAAVCIWARTALRLAGLALGLLAVHRRSPSSNEDYYSPFWWFLQEIDAWVAGALTWTVGTGVAEVAFLAGFLPMTVFYLALGVRIRRGRRGAWLVTNALMVVGAMQLLVVLYLFRNEVHRLTVMPLGSGPRAGRLAIPILWGWPLALLALTLATLVLVNIRPARRYFHRL